MEKPKRKTHTSKEVIERYRKKTFARYSFLLRYDTDGDLIAAIEQKKSEGLGTSDAIKSVMRGEK